MSDNTRRADGLNAALQEGLSQIRSLKAELLELFAETVVADIVAKATEPDSGLVIQSDWPRNYLEVLDYDADRLGAAVANRLHETDLRISKAFDAIQAYDGVQRAINPGTFTVIVRLTA